MFVRIYLRKTCSRIRATRSRSTERQRDRETERADLIICLALETVSNPRGPLTCDDFHLPCIASKNRLRSRPIFFRFFVDVGAPALPKRSPNRAQNPIFGYFFAILFSTTLLDRFFIDFSRVRPLKSSILLRKNNDFHYIDVFAKVQKNASILTPF